MKSLELLHLQARGQRLLQLLGLLLVGDLEGVEEPGATDLSHGRLRNVGRSRVICIISL